MLRAENIFPLEDNEHDETKEVPLALEEPPAPEESQSPTLKE